MNALEVKGLCKSFGKLKAVDDVSFVVPEGSVFGLIGRNGAGKTTTIRMMMNIYEPDSGEVILQGAPVTAEFKQKVGYLPEERGLYKKMNVWDTLMFFAQIKGKTGKDIEQKANEYLKRFQLFTRKTSKVQDLSKGNQQKIQFIATILHDPEFLILDEPFSGLDPINTDLLREIIIDLKNQGKVIIFSTHLMDFAEKMCDHIAMIDNGKIILQGSLKELKARFGHRNVNITYDGNLSFLNGHPIIESIQDFGNTTGITVKEESQTQDLLKLLLDRDIKIRRFNANDISLHEIFVKLAGDKNVEVANV